MSSIDALEPQPQPSSDDLHVGPTPDVVPPAEVPVESVITANSTPEGSDSTDGQQTADSSQNGSPGASTPISDEGTDRSYQELLAAHDTLVARLNAANARLAAIRDLTEPVEIPHPHVKRAAR